MLKRNVCSANGGPHSLTRITSTRAFVSSLPMILSEPTPASVSSLRTFFSGSSPPFLSSLSTILCESIHSFALERNVRSQCCPSPLTYTTSTRAFVSSLPTILSESNPGFLSS